MDEARYQAQVPGSKSEMLQWRGRRAGFSPLQAGTNARRGDSIYSHLLITRSGLKSALLLPSAASLSHFPHSAFRVQ